MFVGFTAITANAAAAHGLLKGCFTAGKLLCHRIQGRRIAFHSHSDEKEWGKRAASPFWATPKTGEYPPPPNFIAPLAAKPHGD
jgi:hypothetical protein